MSCAKCKASFENMDQDWINSDLCDGWYHYECVCLLESPAEDMYVCPECTTREVDWDQRVRTDDDVDYQTEADSDNE